MSETQHRSSRLLSISVGVLWIALAGSLPARAQNTTAAITGLVLDEQGLAVPGATVRVRDASRGVSRTTASGEDGTFELAGLQPGEDRLTAAIAGFANTEVDVRVEVNQRLRLDVKLRPSTVTADVVVRQSVPLLDTVSSSVGQVIDQQQIENLPLNGRQFLELALLVPGAHTSHGAGTGLTLPLYWRPGQNSAISVTGGRPGANAFRIDGTTNTDPSFNTYIVNLPPDAIREFQIETASYSAELGAAGTGQVNVVTKSGTQSLHGSAYRYSPEQRVRRAPLHEPRKAPAFQPAPVRRHDRRTAGLRAHLLLRQLRGLPEHARPVDGDERAAGDVAHG